MKKSMIYLLLSVMVSTTLWAGLSEAEKIVQGSGDGSLLFGYSIDVDGRYAVVGAPDESIVYIYRKDLSGNFVLHGNITGSGLDHKFGTDVTVSDDGYNSVIIAIGEPDYEFYNSKTDTTEYNDVMSVYKLNTSTNIFEALYNVYDNNGTGLGTSLDAAYIKELRQQGSLWVPVTVGVVIAAGQPASNKLTTYFYSYETQTWEIVELTAGAALDEFGHSVAVSNANPFLTNGKARIIIGAPKDDVYDEHRSETLEDKGSAYIYELSGSFSGGHSWINEKHVTQPIPSFLLDGTEVYSHCSFGTAVDISRDRAIVGAPKINIGSETFIPTMGEARVYMLSNPDDNSWVENGTLEQPDNPNMMYFEGYGTAVALENNETAVVGARSYRDESDVITGAIFSYEYQANSATWSETARMLGSGSGTFGTAVDIVDGAPVVGNPDRDTVSILEYLFEGSSPALIMYLLN